MALSKTSLRLEVLKIQALSTKKRESKNCAKILGTYFRIYRKYVLEQEELIGN
jgi:hypothetical protein